MTADFKLLITGGFGFIGSNFILYLLDRYPRCQINNLDKLIYASNPNNLRDVQDNPRYRFIHGDICDAPWWTKLSARSTWSSTSPPRPTSTAPSWRPAPSSPPTSTAPTSSWTRPVVTPTSSASSRSPRTRCTVTCPPASPPGRPDPLHPRSPYAASKAGGDMQCIAFLETYGVPATITRAANNVGPRQHLEKVTPLFIISALNDQPLPLYGDGRQVRDWLYVEDQCRALDIVLHKGQPGDVYNIGADNYQENIHLAEAILDLLGKPRTLIRFVEDRQGHDRRYSLDWSKLRALGWSPDHDFTAALEKTVAWYKKNRWWWEPVYAGRFLDYYQKQYGQRLARGVPYDPEEATSR